MRNFLLISAFALAITYVLFRVHPQLTMQDMSFDVVQNAVFKSPAVNSGNIPSSAELIVDLEYYDDPDYGFSLAVPAGWSTIIANSDAAIEADEQSGSLEPGYAVGFESPRSDSADRFADYILIEVLPGDESGLFSSSDEHRQFLHVGQERLSYDRLFVDSADDEAIDVDLIIFQRGVQAFGYTLGFYAIGEPANEQTLFDAFQIMLRTFSQSKEPFVII